MHRVRNATLGAIVVTLCACQEPPLSPVELGPVTPRQLLSTADFDVVIELPQSRLLHDLGSGIPLVVADLHPSPGLEVATASNARTRPWAGDPWLVDHSVFVYSLAGGAEQGPEDMLAEVRFEDSQVHGMQLLASDPPRLLLETWPAQQFVPVPVESHQAAEDGTLRSRRLAVVPGTDAVWTHEPSGDLGLHRPVPGMQDWGVPETVVTTPNGSAPHELVGVVPSVTGDGDSDLVSFNWATDLVAIHGAGAGTIETGAAAGPAAVVDIGDAWAAQAIAGRIGADDDVDLLLADGFGTLWALDGPLAGAHALEDASLRVDADERGSFAAGDLDGDGFLDLVFGGRGDWAGRVAVFFGPLAGTLPLDAAHILMLGRDDGDLQAEFLGETVLVTDGDGDGYDDLFVTFTRPPPPDRETPHVFMRDRIGILWGGPR